MRLSLFLSGLVAASSAVGVYAQIPDADLVDQSPAGPLHHNDKRLCLLGLCVGGSIDLNTDVNNCGSTGFKCPTSWANGSGAKCSGGRCMPGTCALGYTLNTATASCVNTVNDIANCGTCGNICSLPGANGHTCSAGVCQATSCISGFGLYSGSCKNLATDPANCGTLGNVCQFPGGTGTCSAGKCTLTGCGSGYYAVGGKCVQLNLQTDPLNCGSIGKVCTVANGVAGCSGGACTIASCSPGYQLTTQGSLLGLFGSSSSCTPIDTSSSLQNCGSIGHACAFTNGVGVCQGGTCTYTSCTTSGFYLVGNQCVSLNLATDTKNCGSIGSVCSVPNGVAKCVSGNCQIASCNSGYALTTSGSLLGLFGTSSSCQSVNLASDPSNCGSVGNVCPSTYLNGGPGTCVNGKCATTCGSGFDFDLFYNFCRPVSTDTANCGACGVKCNIANAATQICSNSKCVVTACAPGYTLSNNACVAANYQTDVKNCGSAGHACVFSPAGASGTCQSGVCVTTSCPFGYQLNNGACVLGASAKARAKRSKVSTPKTLCPSGEQACPIAGSTLFVDASAQHFKSGEELTGLMARSGGYECLDTTQSLESCGGCASTGEGQDCTAIPHARGVGCEAGQCRIFSCSSGYKLNLNGDKCIRSRAAGSTQRNNTASHARHISSRRSAHGHSHGRALAAPLSS